MSNKLFSLLAVMTLFTLVACGKEQVQVTKVVEETVVETVVEKETVVERVVETVVVTATPGTPPDWSNGQWPTSSPEEQGMNPEMLSAMLDHVVQTGSEIYSITIIRNGYVVLDEHFSNDDFERDEARPIFSCTKSVVSILVGIAIDRGYIQGVDQPVLSFFPDRTIANLDADKQAMTLEDLLTMSTGLDCQDSYLYNWVGLDEARRSGNQGQYALDLPMVHAPGDYFEYCNGASQLLSTIIQDATGMSAFHFAYEYLFRPLGITKVTWGISREGVNPGFAEMFMTPHDMAKIGLLYLNQGRWNGEQIVSAAWVAESTREHISAGTLAEGYGYHWWVDANGYYMAQGLTRGYNKADGYGGQSIFVVPQRNLVVVFTGKLYDDDFFIPEGLLNDFIIPAAG
jgi:CubicO group peptidase (beta-lactamase class C family)